VHRDVVFFLGNLSEPRVVLRGILR